MQFELGKEEGYLGGKGNEFHFRTTAQRVDVQGSVQGNAYL